ncbi:hypothetical protein EWM60_20485, partial [Candidatus Erwinia dacicola]|nr:hypothetical protein [Candidatus Erwinia dacicola]
MPGMLPGLGHLRDERPWRRYLQAQYGRYWKVHFAKKSRGVELEIRQDDGNTIMVVQKQAASR